MGCHTVAGDIGCLRRSPIARASRCRRSPASRDSAGSDRCEAAGHGALARHQARVPRLVHAAPRRSRAAGARQQGRCGHRPADGAQAGRAAPAAGRATRCRPRCPRLKTVATAFYDNLVQLRRHSTDACFGFISQGEANPAIVALLQRLRAHRASAGAADRRVRGDRRRPQAAARLSAAAPDRLRQAGCRARPSAAGRPADMKLFSDERALAQAAPEKVCQLVHDWFAAQLVAERPGSADAAAGGLPAAGRRRLRCATRVIPRDAKIASPAARAYRTMLSPGLRGSTSGMTVRASSAPCAALVSISSRSQLARLVRGQPSGARRRSRRGRSRVGSPKSAGLTDRPMRRVSLLAQSAPSPGGHHGARPPCRCPMREAPP